MQVQRGHLPRIQGIFEEQVGAARLTPRWLARYVSPRHRTSAARRLLCARTVDCSETHGCLLSLWDSCPITRRRVPWMPCQHRTSSPDGSARNSGRAKRWLPRRATSSPRAGRARPSSGRGGRVGSRTTAYRYFPTQRALLVAAHPEIAASTLVPSDAGDDPEARLLGAVEAFIRIVVDTDTIREPHCGSHWTRTTPREPSRCVKAEQSSGLKRHSHRCERGSPTRRSTGSHCPSAVPSESSHSSGSPTSPGSPVPRRQNGCCGRRERSFCMPSQTPAGLRQRPNACHPDRQRGALERLRS